MYLLTTREFYFFCWKNLYCVYNGVHVFIVLCFYNFIVRFSVKQDYATAVLLEINIIFIDRMPGPPENHSSGMDQFVFQRTGHAQDLRLFRTHRTRRGRHNLSSSVCDTAAAVTKTWRRRRIFRTVFYSYNITSLSIQSVEPVHVQDKRGAGDGALVSLAGLDAGCAWKLRGNIRK